MTDTTTLTDSEATVLAGYDAFGRGDMQMLERLFLPDCTWTHRNAGRLGGTKHGFAAILAFFGESMEMSAGSLRVEPRATVGRDGIVAVFVHMSATAPTAACLPTTRCTSSGWRGTGRGASTSTSATRPRWRRSGAEPVRRSVPRSGDVARRAHPIHCAEAWR